MKKNGRKNAVRRKPVPRAKRVPSQGAATAAPAVAQEDQPEQVNGPVQVVLDNSVPGGFRMEPVCR